MYEDVQSVPTLIDWTEIGAVTSVKAQFKCKLIECGSRSHGCRIGSILSAYDFITRSDIKTDKKYSYKARNGTCDVKKFTIPSLSHMCCFIYLGMGVILLIKFKSVCCSAGDVLEDDPVGRLKVFVYELPSKYNKKILQKDPRFRFLLTSAANSAFGIGSLIITVANSSISSAYSRIGAARFQYLASVVFGSAFYIITAARFQYLAALVVSLNYCFTFDARNPLLSVVFARYSLGEPDAARLHSRRSKDASAARLTRPNYRANLPYDDPYIQTP
ncbi:LOB domain-containing protein 21 [Phtheirospermum japonicum]|uniref:LOB domain-containing protein 21 n=1 Tax=Phtheirospermum japonicum TaxID=374723 RepID=A0A830BQL1_9LAMI|nr:LOB domain-containing protein 21 [Phtheirospermum japonicum]